MSRFLDGATRALILALSAFATLAIIGSIAAIPSGEVARQLGVGGEQASVAPAPTDEVVTPAPEETGNIAAAEGKSAIEGAPPQRSKTERWLEVIAYALIAIAGLLAVMALTLMRATAHLRDRS